jgi:hypothetical protein
MIPPLGSRFVDGHGRVVVVEAHAPGQWVQISYPDGRLCFIPLHLFREGFKRLRRSTHA